MYFRLKERLQKSGRKVIVLLLSEIFPAKLEMFGGIDAFIQVACPRLSIDWGHAFKKPLLSPYEAEVALELTQWRAVYPMDFYSKDGGPWSNYHPEVSRRSTRKAKISAKNPRRRAPVKIAYEL
mmetsp:Transcript_15006/g.22704  ORF Transcript_15006/g.22704 Transcript_15006/m.22704 type:complete len:124 (+) Transcript_15006:20-391(+)